MGVVNKLILNFYILFSFLFIFGKKKEETSIPQPMQVPGAQPVQLPTPQNVSKPGEEKPMFRIEQPTIPYLPEIKDPRTLNVRYPLIPPYTFARIRWDAENTELVYEIEEPLLTDKEKQTLDILEDGIKELINLSFISVKDRDTVLVYLEKNIRVLLAELSIELNIESFLKIMYYIYRDFVGLNELEPLMNDYFIEDVECNGLNTPVYVVHRKYRNVRTNLIYKDIHKMASFVEKLAQKCGRYVSYAEPVLDGSLPDGSRINATYSIDITTRGPTFSIRKFTKEPWSPLQLMIKGTCSAEIYAYLWMTVEYENSLMIVGGTGSGKTSFVNSVAFFIPPQARVVTIEDTRELTLEHENWLPSVARAGVGLTNLLGQKYGEVTLFDLLKASFRQRPDYIIVGEVRGSIRGNEEIVVIENGITKRVPIKELEGKDISNMFVPTLDKNLKVELHKIKHFIKHPPRSQLVEVVTRTGRKVVVTHDHSLFTADGCEVKPIETSKLNLGDKILIPASMPCGYNDVDKINLIEYFPELRIYNVQDKIKEAISKLGQEKANEICGCVARQYCRKKQKTSVPIKHFVKLMESAKIHFDLKNYQIKNGNSKLVPKDITVNEDFCRFLGYYLAEGHIQNTNRDVVITNSDKIIINDVIEISKKLFGITPKLKRVYGYGKSWHIIIHSTIITRLINNLCGKTESKRVPSLIYGLSRNKINAFLNGAYSGDGNNYKNEISFASKLGKLSEDIMYLLLTIGIVSRIKKDKNKNLFRVLFKRIEDTKKFLDEVGFTQKNYKVLQKGPLHSNVNLVNFKEIDFNKLKLPRKYRHLKRFMKCSKYYLQNIIDDVNAHDDIKKFANGEFYLDEIKQLNDINLKVAEPVYDLSINPTENFIGGFGGIVLHNSEAFVLFQAFASIRGDEEIFVLYEDKPLKIKIKNLENYDINKLKAVSYNLKEKKCEIKPIKGWIKHPKRNTLYKITTKSGREVTITQDHSVFTYENKQVKEIKGEDLVIGSKIVIPSRIESGYNNISKINLLEYLPDLRIYAPEYVKEASHKLGYYQASALVNCKSITDYYSEGIVSKPNAMKGENFLNLIKEAEINCDLDNLKVKFNGMSEKHSVFLDLSDEFLRLLGYYISEGSLNTSGRNYRIEFYNSDEKILRDMEDCIIKVVNKKPKRRITDRGWGSAIELSFNHKILYELIKRYCRTKLEKRIPDFIYGLDKKRIGLFLGALYTGDGAVMDKGIGYYTTSKNLANDVTQLLLVYGIVATISERNREGRKTTDYEINFYANYKKEEFLKYVKPINKSCKIINGVEDKNLIDDLYCDKVKSIEVLHLDELEHVYDISVPGTENFIGGFGSVLLHNSGHPGMATMHAESVDTMVKRLQTAPINLSGSLIETLAAVVVMTQSKIKGKEVRKVSSIDEIIQVKEQQGGAVINTVFKWDPKTDKFTFNPNSKVFENIATHFGFTKEQVLNEFNIRVKLFKELFKRGIINFKEVQKIVHEYYKSPEVILKRYGLA